MMLEIGFPPIRLSLLFVKEKKKRLAFFNQDSGRNAITFSIYFL
jgi:hypothetical protein